MSLPATWMRLPDGTLRLTVPNCSPLRTPFVPTCTPRTWSKAPLGLARSTGTEFGTTDTTQATLGSVLLASRNGLVQVSCRRQSWSVQRQDLIRAATIRWAAYAALAGAGPQPCGS